MEYRHKTSLWGYKKLANNEIVKDDEDISKTSSSCFKLKKTLKKLFIKSHQKCKELNQFEAESANNTRRRIIKELKRQQAEESEKTKRRSLYTLISKSRSHQQLGNENEKCCEESSRDAYIASGIYDKFGNSCTASIIATKSTKQQEVEAEDLSASSWYQSGIIGKFSEEILQHQTPGTFIIHRVSQKSGNFILSLRAPSQTSSKVVHFMILQSKQGYRLKGAAKYFNTITSLVTHHSVLAEQLPVTLTLQRNYEINRKSSQDDEVSDDDYSIDDLGAIFTDLEV